MRCWRLRHTLPSALLFSLSTLPSTLSAKEHIALALAGHALALAGTLRTSLHLLVRKVGQVTAGGSIAALHVSLLATESELLVLLRTPVGTAVSATALALGLAGLLNGDVKEILGVVGGGGRIGLALCKVGKEILARELLPPKKYIIGPDGAWL